MDLIFCIDELTLEFSFHSCLSLTELPFHAAIKRYQIAIYISRLLQYVELLISQIKVTKPELSNLAHTCSKPAPLEQDLQQFLC